MSVTDLPDEEKELLPADFCGCGTVNDLIKEAADEVRAKRDDDKCILWHLAKMALVEQIFQNVLLNAGAKKDGIIEASMKFGASNAAVNSSVRHIMTHATEHISGILKELIDGDDDAVEEETSKGQTIQ